jgi:hypothetical protein
MHLVALLQQTAIISLHDRPQHNVAYPPHADPKKDFLWPKDDQFQRTRAPDTKNNLLELII